MTSRFHGAFRSRLEGDGGGMIDPARLRRDVYQVLAQRSPALKDLKIGPIQREASGSWFYEASYHVPSALEDASGVALLDLFPLVDAGIVPVPDDAKQGSLYLPLLATRRDRFEIVVEGGTLAGWPQDFEVKNALGRVAFEAHQELGRLSIKREFRTDAREVTVAARRDAQELRRALGRLNGLSLRFNPR
jgi:hypothetical protein